MIKIKRIYEDVTKDDGYRVLVDRLWPRGIKKTDAKIDEWMKEIAPSDSLRKWFSHDIAKWHEFKKKYKKELDLKGNLLNELRQKTTGKELTLLYSASDKEHNQAIVLKEYLSQKKGAGF